MKSALGALTCLALLLTPAVAAAAPPGTLSATDPIVNTPPGAQAQAFVIGRPATAAS